MLRQPRKLGKGHKLHNSIAAGMIVHLYACCDRPIFQSSARFNARQSGLVMTANGDSVASERRDLRRGAMQILSGFGVRTVARILLLTFVARFYGIADFGRLGETVALLELAAAFATFGLSRTLLGALGNGDTDHSSGKSITEAVILAATTSFIITVLLFGESLSETSPYRCEFGVSRNSCPSRTPAT